MTGGEPRVVDEDPRWVAVYKPPLVHSAPLREGEGGTLLDWCALRYPEIRALRGRKAGEGGLLHRLDYGTSGLVLLARTQAALDRLVSCQEAGLFIKRYLAWTAASSPPPPGFPPPPPSPPGFPAPVESAFRPWGPGRRAVRPVLPAGRSGGPVYRTLILGTRQEGASRRFDLEISRGFRHQIRCHLAWLGFPILGDGLYGGPLRQDAPGLALLAGEIVFPDPLSGEPRVCRLPRKDPGG